MSLLRRVAAVLGRIGADPEDAPELRERKVLLLGTSMLILPAGLLWGSLYLVFGEPLAALLPYAYVAVSATSILAFAATRSFALLRRVQLLNILAVPAVLSAALGGLAPSGAVIAWSLLAPLGAIVFGDVGRAWRWFAAFLLLIPASELAAAALGMSSSLPPPLVLAFLGMNIGAMAGVAFALLLTFAVQRQTALRLLRAEQEKAESLLLNILPSRIAELLKGGSGTIADRFESASILFADVVDFTPLSARLSPEQVVQLLDHLFRTFDELAERHGLEKIKTIGDAYMVAAGVPTPRADHAHAIARLALDMQDSVATHHELAELGLQFRIGINSGPVIAGVIGRKRLIYDLWGDAVNTASRMESQGVPGRIQVTRATYDLISDAFVCEPRGAVTVKGKGEMETWYLIGSRERPSTAADDAAGGVAVAEAGVPAPAAAAGTDW